MVFLCGMIIDREGWFLVVSVLVNVVWVDLKIIISKGGVGYNECWQVLVSVLYLFFSMFVEWVNSNLVGCFIYFVCQVLFQ